MNTRPLIASLFVLLATPACDAAETQDPVTTVEKSFAGDGEELTVRATLAGEELLEVELDHRIGADRERIALDPFLVGDDEGFGPDGEALQGFLAGLSPAFLDDIRDSLLSGDPVGADAHPALYPTLLGVFLMPEAEPHEEATYLLRYAGYAVCWWACIGGGGTAVGCEGACQQYL